MRVIIERITMSWLAGQLVTLWRPSKRSNQQQRNHSFWVCQQAHHLLVCMQKS